MSDNTCTNLSCYAQCRRFKIYYILSLKGYAKYLEGSTFENCAYR
jgi:hypothetical protein